MSEHYQTFTASTLQRAMYWAQIIQDEAKEQKAIRKVFPHIKPRLRWKKHDELTLEVIKKTFADFEHEYYKKYRKQID